MNKKINHKRTTKKVEKVIRHSYLTVKLSVTIRPHQICSEQYGPSLEWGKIKQGNL